MSYHQPVLLQEVLQLFAPHAGKVFCDATLGGGGHTRALLEAGAQEVIGVDRDPEALAHATEVLAPYGERAKLRQGNFRDLPRILTEPVSGLLLDLGVSSAQLDRPERGFSFKREGPLDMRMGPDAETLEDLLARVSEEELANILYRYGEERKSRPIARAIRTAWEKGALKTTGDLAAIIHRIVGYPKRGKIDPATRSFQALRIALNDELGALEELLEHLPALLLPGGVAVIISYHSLEDRLVKHAFREHAKGCVCPKELPLCVCGKKPTLEILTPHPILPSEEEISQNPRARSAKLRAARRR